MSIQSPNSYYAPNVGVGYENVEVPHIDTRAPTVYDYKYPLGKRWIDQQGVASYALCSVSSVGGEMQAVWIAEGGAGSGVIEIETAQGNANSVSGKLNFAAGASGNLTVSAAGDTFTVDTAQICNNISSYYFYTGSPTTSLKIDENNISADGSNANVDVNIYPKGSGNLILNSNNLILDGANSKLEINASTSSSASCGQATLAAGTATVSTTAVTANSIIFLSVDSLGTVTAPQAMYISAITAGVSFAITSADATDTSVVNYLIIN